MKGWTQNEKFNYDGVTTDAPAPLEPGLYKARITEATPQPTKEGKPMIKLTCEVFENENGDATPKRKLTDNMVLSQAALFRVKIIADALGIEPLADSSLESAEAFCRDIVDAAKAGVWVKVKTETYTRKGGDAENPADQRKAARVDRYLSEDKVAEAASTSKANGAGTATAARRPRPTSTATA
jgi:hypothetical protein